MGAKAAPRAGAGYREVSVAWYSFLHRNGSESGQQKRCD